MGKYKNLIEEAERLEAAARQCRQEAEEAHAKARRGNLKKWVGYSFESSSGITPEFAEFSKAVRKHLKAIPGYALVKYSRGHFEFFAFLKNEVLGKLAFVSCSDVRFFPDEWHNKLLIRTAEDESDYKGGVNCYTPLSELKPALDKLTSRP